MKKVQSGFTLIEIAIVLVIIGLLLGGVLKGQELINSAKVKNLANDMRAIQTAVFAFQDKYKALPGDYLKATAETTFTGSTFSGDGNGVIAATEAGDAWDQMRKANLITGSGTTAPTNAVGGALAISGTAAAFVTGLSGNVVVCSGAIPGALARQLDISMDDGVSNAGNVRSAKATGAADATYVDADTYTVCMSF